jgi:hypothetical protein
MGKGKKKRKARRPALMASLASESSLGRRLQRILEALGEDRAEQVAAIIWQLPGTDAHGGHRISPWHVALLVGGSAQARAKRLAELKARPPAPMLPVDVEIPPGALWLGHDAHGIVIRDRTAAGERAPSEPPAPMSRPVSARELEQMLQAGEALTALPLEAMRTDDPRWKAMEGRLPSRARWAGPWRNTEGYAMRRREDAGEVPEPSPDHGMNEWLNWQREQRREEGGEG